MQPDVQHESRRWYDQAVRDLDDARFNLNGARYNLACFVAQQAAEKALKAYLILHSEEEPWGHSVAELCRESAKIDPTFAGVVPEAAPLDKFYIPTRYPNGLPGGIPADAFSKADAESAVMMADIVLSHVRSRL